MRSGNLKNRLVLVLGLFAALGLNSLYQFSVEENTIAMKHGIEGSANLASSVDYKGSVVHVDGCDIQLEGKVQKVITSSGEEYRFKGKAKLSTETECDECNNLSIKVKDGYGGDWYKTRNLKLIAGVLESRLELNDKCKPKNIDGDYDDDDEDYYKALLKETRRCATRSSSQDKAVCYLERLKSLSDQKKWSGKDKSKISSAIKRLYSEKIKRHLVKALKNGDRDEADELWDAVHEVIVLNDTTNFEGLAKSVESVKKSHYKKKMNEIAGIRKKMQNYRIHAMSSLNPWDRYRFARLYQQTMQQFMMTSGGFSQDLNGMIIPSYAHALEDMDMVPSGYSAIGYAGEQDWSFINKISNDIMTNINTIGAGSPTLNMSLATSRLGSSRLRAQNNPFSIPSMSTVNGSLGFSTNPIANSMGVNSTSLNRLSGRAGQTGVRLTTIPRPTM